MAQGPLAEESEGPLMSPIVLPTAYLAPISYYAVLYAADEVVIEAQEHYTKQTLRTRCTIATDQGPQTLSVNVEKGNKLKMPIGEVRLSNHGDWQRQHLYSWATYYGNSPFYEYYIDDLRETFLHGHDGTLFGMNEALRRHICREIGFEPKVRYSEQWMGPLDCVAPNGTFKPEIMKQAMTVDLDGLDREIVFDLLDKQNNEELYKYLLITQCNALHKGLPGMFEKIGAWTELLFPKNLLRDDSVIAKMISDIPEEDWKEQVEIIGWLYQYYNTEPKDKVFSRPSGQKIRKEDVPAATQLFTPDWIVRYMVENSLGRTWTDIKPDTDLKSEWKYYLSEAEQSDDVQTKLLEMRKSKGQTSVEEITFLDPCMGSGHILVYAFDVFMQIYTSLGYTERDAAQKIVENNLYGLELDDRAAQLAYFAVMMKARSYDRRFLGRGIRPNLCSIQESNNINPDYLELFGELKETARKLYDEFIDAKEYGSILNLKITAEEIAQLEEKCSEIIDGYYENIFDSIRQVGIRTDFPALIRQAKIMVQKYSVVCTNPPYMGGGFSPKLDAYIKKNYADSKSDLFAVFIEKGNSWVACNGYNCMVTMQSWMFLSSYEKMRKKILANTTITNLMHMENMVMGIAFGTAVTVFYNKHIRDYRGTYNQIKLCDIENGHPKEFPVSQDAHRERYLISIVSTILHILVGVCHFYFLFLIRKAFRTINDAFYHIYVLFLSFSHLFHSLSSCSMDTTAGFGSSR